MGRFSGFARKEASGQAAKIATDALWTQENGTNAYKLAGIIFIGCGIVWGIISLIPIMVGEPVSRCIWMWIVAAVQRVAGSILVILSNRSKAFHKWANRDFEKDKKKYFK